MRYIVIGLLLCIGNACAAASPSPTPALTVPTSEEATQALLKMLDLMEFEQIAETKLGTCIPADLADHPGQVACTVALKLGAATSETQADFYRDGKEWIAQPSQSQEKLPFPDPNL